MTDHPLAEALAAFQAEAPTLPKDGFNPHFKSRFTKLDTIRETIGPLLSKHGLTWQTFPCYGPGNEPALRYTLTHVSGDSQSDVMPLMLAKQSAQDLGSAITYARRYSVTAVLDLVADEDDDGNNASRPSAAHSNGHASAPEPEPEPVLLDENSVREVLAAIKKAAAGTEWVRGQLVAVGVQHVPEGALTKGTIQHLTGEQAVELVKACDAYRTTA